MIQQTHFTFCPGCGKKHIAVHEKNGMKCLDCGYVYFHNCASAVAAIIETKDGILLTKRNHAPKKNFLDLPGGFSDYNETLETALRREIREELSLDLSRMSYFGSFPNVYKHKNVTYFTIDAFFVCTAKNISAMNANEELSEVLIVKPKDIDLEKVAFVSIRNALSKYCETCRKYDK